VDCIHGPISADELEEIKEAHGEKPAQLKGIQLYIDPDVCIDCGACEPECPVEAIFDEDDLPSKWNSYVESNAEFFE
jgi:NAD-dependent dihydropyrimidine dehydrogenase PreA subunit